MHCSSINTKTFHGKLQLTQACTKQTEYLPQTGNYAILAEQALETMWSYLSPNHTRNQIMQKKYHVHSGGRHFWYRLKR